MRNNKCSRQIKLHKINYLRVSSCISFECEARRPFPTPATYYAPGDDDRRADKPDSGKDHQENEKSGHQGVVLDKLTPVQASHGTVSKKPANGHAEDFLAGLSLHQAERVGKKSWKTPILSGLERTVLGLVETFQVILDRLNDDLERLRFVLASLELSVMVFLLISHLPPEFHHQGRCGLQFSNHLDRVIVALVQSRRHVLPVVN